MLVSSVMTAPEATEQRNRLQQLVAAARAARDAQAQVQALAVAAVVAGTPAAHVARAAGIGRATLYRWMEKAS